MDDSHLVQSQTGRGVEQPDPAEDVPAHCMGVGTR